MAASTPDHQTHKSRVTKDNECRPIREDWFTHLNISSEVMVKLFYKKISVQHEVHIGQNGGGGNHTTYFPLILIYVFLPQLHYCSSQHVWTHSQADGK